MEGSVPPRPKAQRFPALSVLHFRLYAITAGHSMVADNIEHVIGYWVIWELTHSPHREYGAKGASTKLSNSNEC